MFTVQIDSDCEGPLSLNDNAFELCAAFLPRGEKFFTQVSRYDDYLADIEKRPGYKGGDTLKLIIPFLILFGLGKEKIKNFSQRTLVLLEDGKLLTKISFPAFLISTSYSEYALEVARVVGIPEENVYSTFVEWDKYKLSLKEKEKLGLFYQEILNLPPIKISAEAKNLNDLSEGSRRAIKRLDEIFFQEIPSLKVGRVFWEVSPVGGEEKARALADSQKKTGIPFEKIVYFGDSLTDKQALEKVRKEGGLAVAVNANRYALKEAELAVLTSSVYPLVLIAWILNEKGKEGIFQHLGGEKLKSLSLPSFLRKKDYKDYKIVDLKKVSWQDFYQESEAFRRKLRGEKIGSLG